MKRQFHTVRRPDLEGSPRSHALAAALAEKCDPELLERFLEIKAILDSIGGQVYFAAYRTKYSPEGVPLEDVKQPGRYETDGYVFHWEHIARINRQRIEPDAKIEETPETLYEPSDVLAALEEQAIADAEVEAVVAADEGPEE